MEAVDIDIQNIDLVAEKKEILNRYRKMRKLAQTHIKDKEEAKLITEAFKVAAKAHEGTRRKSGEPYIFHPIAVAQIVVEEIGLGPTAVAAALLHDVVEDTEWTTEDIERKFGKKVALIVEGVTKIQTSPTLSIADWGVSQQAENFRKMVLTLSDDVRVIMVKIADRLHNMRTLSSMRQDKQLKIASETIYLYAPLAHRLGLYQIKTELEDLYLKYTLPNVYKDIAEKLEKNKIQRNKFIKEFIAPLEENLKKSGFKARIFGRPKSIYSIWNKIQTQGVTFEEIYDLFAIRIILDSKPEDEKSDCWRVYSMVTDNYHPNPKRLRDWITTPRNNGYESLHATVMSKEFDSKGESRWVEVQIRTERMDEIAEKGYAAHWKYKALGKNSGRTKESGLDSWLGYLRDLKDKEDQLSAKEFISAFKANFLKEDIFVFTPAGQLKKMQTGSTVLDFAFDVHTEVGLTCLGSKVNKKLVPLSYELKNGDQVAIITSKQSKPNADWLKFVVTTKAKEKIKEFIRNEKKEFIIKGKEIVEKKMKQFKLEVSDALLNTFREFLEYKNLSDVFFDIAKGYISTKTINKFEKYKQDKDRIIEIGKNKLNNPTTAEEKKVDKKGLLIVGENNSGMDYSLAKCCNPVPGNPIFGFITMAEGVKIHRTDCPNATNMLSNYGYRVVSAVWSSQKHTMFLVDLDVEGNDRTGLIRDVTLALSTDLQVNIASLDMGLKGEGIFYGHIKLYVRDQEHLDTLVERLKMIDGVDTITRHDERNDDLN
ncbi:MAG: bifunctional (p)ppGpp synthetase/guanosine-3',5'-bis(diphosphate) 3'-pyrophosphohydrolase [Bacteroidetes bacterium]|nr:MAG: bifunctional (p)ppGpp synthetase/guanosine-3',5'-bis(diphosphate) 3'-pyrophosphohydrolase [Bacteroidota bacterium]TAG89316.1 MAG: bifunctional (p)ppGpp synthetase/guanosine-3',5'-bis(diphosphate) 3'-pyrophosphohydrolase [Bacteroidota bacterium]